MSDRPQKQASAKADLLTFGSGVMTNSLLMELSIGDETNSLTLCANMAGFGKAGHICDWLWENSPSGGFREARGL